VGGLLGMVGVFIIVIGTCGFGTIKMFKTVINGPGSVTRWDIRLVKWCGGGLPFVQQVDKGLKGTYIVLLQNNYELRSTGGFMGSYARVKLGSSGLNVEVKDIYDADGKLPGHVEPPYPIQEAFLQGWWKLRDSNWVVEYPKAASDIVWFLEQGGERQVDGIVAVNMELFKKWLEVMGGVDVTTYGQKVTAKNMYVLAQKEAEMNFVPGSTQKRDFLGAVGAALLEKTKGAGVIKSIKLMKLIKDELRNRQILVWFKDKDLQTEAEKWGWSGDLPKLPVGVSYVYVVESNLGANKANCCIERDLEINERGVKITWRNENEFSKKMVPIFYGGDYFDYVRIVVPKAVMVGGVKVDNKVLRAATENDFKIPNSLRKEISWEMYNMEKYGDFQIIGFWVRTNAKQESTAEISWNLSGYKGIMVDRQPGIDGFGLKVDFEGKQIFDGQLANRQIVWFN
jgi:Protein of unknown function (DUF4012)